MMDLDQFEAHLERALVTIKPRLELGLSKVGGLAQSLAAEYIGHEMPTWAALAASTIEDKESKGFAVPDPLLRTGEMRDSIKTELVPEELAVVVGSPSLIALWQEMGTANARFPIPPRSFLGLGMSNSLPYAADVYGEIAVILLVPKT